RRGPRAGAGARGRLHPHLSVVRRAHGPTLRSSPGRRLVRASAALARLPPLSRERGHRRITRPLSIRPVLPAPPGPPRFGGVVRILHRTHAAMNSIVLLRASTLALVLVGLSAADVASLSGGGL